MSALASSVARSEAPAARVAAAPRPRGRALLFAVILVTGISAFALSLASFLRPIGEGDLPDYAALAPHRSFVWTFFFVAGLQLVVGAGAAALAAWLLAPERGARWATVGACFVWLGAAIYGVGVGGWGTVYFYASDPAVLGPRVAARLVDHVNDDSARILGLPAGGALLVALGSLLLAVALWRARTVPRWVPVLGALTAVATVVLPPDAAPGLVAEAASSVSTIAVGWYAWRGYRAAAGPRTA